MNGIELSKEKIRNMGIAKFSSLVVKHFYNTDWTLTADACGVSEILNEPRHERVRRAQSFGDDDYASAINRFLSEIFHLDESFGLLIIQHIIQQNKLNPDENEELDQILNFFVDDPRNIDSLIGQLKTTPNDEFLKAIAVPDDFYRKLINEINLLYENQLPMSLSILIRKLFENLIIDILRKKYGTAELSLYYNTSRGRFHDFSVLLQNLDSRKTDFHYISPNLDKSFIQNINQYRETGNSGAHSIDVKINFDYFSQNKDVINHNFHFLVRILQNV